MRRVAEFFLYLICLLNLSSGLSAQTVYSPELENQLQATRSILAQLQDEIGGNDIRLLESLEQLADRLMSLNQYAEAHDALDRAQQLVRVNDGLYTSKQVPFLGKKIDNFVNWGDWGSAQTLIEHLFWLSTRKIKNADGRLVESLMHLSDIHLRGVAEDIEENQTQHFFDAAIQTRLALNIAQEIWSRNDPRLAPVLYNQLKLYYFQSVAIDRGGRAGYGLRQIANGRERILRREESLEIFYRNGLQLLAQLKGIYALSEPVQLEQLAMADLYLADWQLLFSKRGEALRSYQLAFKLFTEAGVNNDQLSTFFGQLVVLPELTFYENVLEAIVHREQGSETGLREITVDASQMLSFSEWSSAFPNIRRPGGFPNQDGLESNAALISFSLTGLHGASITSELLVISALGAMQNIELVQKPDSVEVKEEELFKKLNSLRFRPKLVEGVPQDASGVLKYLLVADN
jgi:hypothetical protein